MTNWMPSLEERGGPRYVAIAEALAEDISKGHLKPGDRLPTHRDLGWKLGVTVGTVSRAYAEAERRGLISGEVGRGTYVRDLSRGDPHVVMASSPGESDTINFNFAFPIPTGTETAFADTLAEIARDPAASSLFDYSPHAGLERHRVSAAQWLSRRSVEADPARIVITAGAQHALLVCLAATTRPGDRIACDQLTYSGMQVIARLLGLRLEGLASDAQGLSPEAFESACRSGDIRALYCVPTMHNPTTLTMPLERRREIAAIAQSHQVPIIEDDIFGLLQDASPPPISSLLPDLCFFVTSLSKTLAPGLRIGYVAAPNRFAQNIAAAVRASCWMAAPLLAEIATRWISDGTADRIMAARKEEADARREIALRLLDPWKPACPPGSIYLWLELPEPWRASDFALASQRRNVSVTPADACMVGRYEGPAAVRICLGPPRTRDDLERGLTVLVRLLEGGRVQSFGEIV